MADTLKLDLKRKFRHLYNPTPKQVSIVDVPALNFLLVDGSGDPNTSQEYQDAIGTLYGAAYTLKFMVKKREISGLQPVDYPLMALEGLWWSDSMAEFTMARKESWNWTMMIMQPEFVTAPMVSVSMVNIMRFT